MSDVNFVHVPTLAELLVMGAGQGFIEINTSNLGKRINKSQQGSFKTPFGIGIPRIYCTGTNWSEI